MSQDGQSEETSNMDAVQNRKSKTFKQMMVALLKGMELWPKSHNDQG